MPNPNDPEVRAIISAMDVDTRRAWDKIREHHENTLQDAAEEARKAGVSAEEVSRQMEQMRAAQELNEFKFINAEQERRESVEVEFRDAPIAPPPVSRFIPEPVHVEQTDPPPVQHAIQPEAQTRFMRQSPPAERETPITDDRQIQRTEDPRMTPEEVEAAQKRGDLKPVSFERHVAADANVFETRRQDVREFCETEMKAELEATLKGVNDVDIIKQETERLKAEWAETQSERLAKIDREQADRLDRTRQLYCIERD